LYPESHYRLLYGESDGFPGLSADRFGELVVLQLASAVAEAHAEALAQALLALPGVAGLVLRRDAGARAREGLPEAEPQLRGQVSAQSEAREAGLRFPLDPLAGAKGGWYWDQRDSRAWLRACARGASVLDLFCNTGGFALQAAAGGAREVLGLDRSESALGLAREAAERNGLSGTSRFRVLDLFRQKWPRGHWDRVALDPPALAKDRGEIADALGAYAHLNRKAAARVAPGGILLTCSCTYPVEERIWQGTVLRALHTEGRHAQILLRGGQGADHPVLPGMPETRYLKVMALRLD
jgi:23S rRNA (cytosine1962-C5)-methyltransferase